MLDLVLRKEVYPMSRKSEQRSLGRRIAGVTMPISRRRMRWGRNWPCLCGSDKKYKRCCLNEIDSFTASDGNANVDKLSPDIQKMIDYQRDMLKNGGKKHNE